VNADGLSERVLICDTRAYGHTDHLFNHEHR